MTAKDQMASSQGPAAGTEGTTSQGLPRCLRQLKDAQGLFLSWQIREYQRDPLRERLVSADVPLEHVFSSRILGSPDMSHRRLQGRRRGASLT